MSGCLTRTLQGAPVRVCGHDVPSPDAAHGACGDQRRKPPGTVLQVISPRVLLLQPSASRLWVAVGSMSESSAGSVRVLISRSNSFADSAALK